MKTDERIDDTPITARQGISLILRERIVWVSRDILLRGGIAGKLKLLFPESPEVQQVVKGNNAQYPHEQGHEQKTGQQN
jgi:hypothetical protein